MKKTTIFILFLFVTVAAAAAQVFVAPDNFVPSREMVLDKDHLSSKDMLFNEAFRFFLYNEPFNNNVGTGRDLSLQKKDKKAGFTDKENLLKTVGDIFKPENILNFHDVTSQMNTEERIAAAVATGYLFDNDYRVYNRLDADMKKSRFWQNNGSALSALGDAGVDLGIFGLISLKGDEKSKQVAQMGAEGLISLNMQLAKRIVGMNRPSDTTAHLGPSFTYDAFPSGHSYSVFTAATILGEAYKLKWLTYPLAYLSAFSRIQQNTHWPSDVIVGGLWGHLNARYIMYRHNFIQEDKIKENKLFENSKIDIDGKYNAYYDTNIGCVNANTSSGEVGRLNMRWNFTQKISDRFLAQCAFHYRGQIPHVLQYNSVKDVSYIPRLSYKLSPSAFAYAEYEDNRILYNNMSRTPHMEEMLLPPANLVYIDNFRTKTGSLGAAVKLDNRFYLKGVYSDGSSNYQAFTNLNSRGRSGDFEAGANYPDKNLLVSASFHAGEQTSANELYSYRNKGLVFSLNQKFLNAGTIRVSYLNENNWYKNWHAANAAGTAFWKAYGLEYRQDFQKDWNVNVGVFQRGLLSNINNWTYSKYMYMIEFNKAF